MIATVAGAFMAPVTQLETDVGFIGIKALAGAIIGGFGSIPGDLAGMYADRRHRTIRRLLLPGDQRCIGLHRDVGGFVHTP